MQLKLVPMWPEPASLDHVQRVDAGRRRRTRRATGSVERADPRELGERDVAERIGAPAWQSRASLRASTRLELDACE